MMGWSSRCLNDLVYERYRSIRQHILDQAIGGFYTDWAQEWLSRF